MSRLLRPSMWTESTMIVNQERVDVLSVPTLGRRFKMVKKTGDFLYHRQKGNKNIVVTHGIMALYRSHAHMLDYYQTHHFFLQELITACQANGVDFIRLRQATVDEPWTILTKRRIGEQIEALRPKLDEYLRNANNQIALTITFKDSLGRVNKGVMLCRNETTMRNLIHRLSAIHNIRPYVQMHAQRIRGVTLLLERELEGALYTLEQIHDVVNGEHPEWSFRDHAFKNLFVTLQWHIQNLVIKPYGHLAKHLQQELGEMLAFAQAHQWSELSAVTRKSMYGCKLMQLRLPLELAKLHLDRAGKFGSMQPSLLRRIRTRLMNMEINDLSTIDDSGFSTQNIVRDVLVAVMAINVLLRIDNPDFALVVEFVDRALKPI